MAGEHRHDFLSILLRWDSQHSDTNMSNGKFSNPNDCFSNTILECPQVPKAEWVQSPGFPCIVNRLLIQPIIHKESSIFPMNQ